MLKPHQNITLQQKSDLHTFVFIVFFSSAHFASSQPSQQLISAAQTKSELKRLAEAFILEQAETTENVKYKVLSTPMDPRIKVPSCPEGFQASMPHNTKVQYNNRVKVTCMSPDQARPWSTHVRVRFYLLYPTIIAATNISTGEKIQKRHLKIKYMQKNKLKTNHFSDIQLLEGVRIKRRILKEQQITSKIICMVCKGDVVSIQAKSKRFNLQTLGRAISDGNIGDSIKVKNNRSNKVIHATVTEVGIVKVRA